MKVATDPFPNSPHVTNERYRLRTWNSLFAKIVKVLRPIPKRQMIKFAYNQQSFVEQN